MPDGDARLTRQQRRRAKRYSIKQFHEESAGAFALALATPLDLLALAGARPELLLSLADWVKRIEQTQPLCACCPVTFTLEEAPALWIVMQPIRHDPQGCMLMGVCAGCCDGFTSREQLLDAIVASLRSVWPDLRALDPMHLSPTGGSA